ncbi:MAG TPA: transglycosylase SLT domain-containing protein, partial [Candidatus Acidoferrales bacterium]|nr:transglycosylase SLT domain-containing protein [Candidatus Acidoferrales bacterium]
ALGQAQRAAGNTLAAIETLQIVYYQFPLSAQAEPANALLSQWRLQIRTGYPQPSETLRRTRAELLWAQKAYRSARSAYLDLAMHAADTARREAAIRAALALYLTGTQRGACGEIAGVDGAGTKAEAEWRSLRARCAVLDDDTRTVEAEFAALAASAPASEWYEAALLAAGDTALVRGNKVLAQQYYRRLIAAFPQSSSSAEAHWKLAWQAYRARNPESARLMQEHLERFPDSPFLPRALYWRARLAVAAKEDALAERLLTLLRDYAPRDYTAQQGEILAAQIEAGPAGDEDRLPAWVAGLRFEVRPPAVEPLLPAYAAQIEKAAALSRLGLYDLATEGLDAALDRQPHPSLYLAQARVAFAQQKFARATVLLTRAYPRYWRYRLEDLPREAWELMYPKLYWEIIQREARKQNLDPYLVAGLIRQESRFENEAVSSAGAIGLMQLMPGTARRLAGRRVSRGGLYDPETNIRLGTKFLAGLMAQFGGSVEKAVAGYNAGGGRVIEWSSEPHADSAEFVESISITQTREFVHTVLRNYRFYRDLYPPR